MKELPIGQGMGQGHGLEGRYMGLPDPYGTEPEAAIVILPVPFDQTSTYKSGSSLGPAALIEASRNLELYDIETDSEVYRKGIFTAPEVKAATSEEMLKRTCAEVRSFLDRDKFIVTLGGEHSISFAAIKAHAEKFGPLTILQFDAHADLQPAYENNPWSHASVMARVKELPEVVKVIAVGIRSMSAEELPFLDAGNTFFSHQLEDNKNWIEQVLNRLTGPVYITFDLDAFDSSLMPSTGTPEPGGLMWNETLKVLKRVASEKQIVGFDVVELCPSPHNIAPDYLAAKLVYKTLSYIFSSN